VPDNGNVELLGAIINCVNEYVMKPKIKSPKKKLKFILSEEEFETVYALYSKTDCHSMSEYVRRVCVQKPVIIIHRNETAETFLTAMLQFKKELETTLRPLKPDDEFNRKDFKKKFEDFCLYLHKMYEQWSRA
jgi:hypothetical protein